MSASALPALASASVPTATEKKGHMQKAAEKSAAFCVYAKRNGLNLTCFGRIEGDRSRCRQIKLVR